jgi:hypothetical protein
MTTPTARRNFPSGGAHHLDLHTVAEEHTPDRSWLTMGTGNVAMPVHDDLMKRRITDQVAKGNAVFIANMPSSAILMDDGATLDLFKTLMGVVKGTFQVESDNKVAVGNENASLTSMGTNLVALWLTDKSGTRTPRRSSRVCP